MPAHKQEYQGSNLLSILATEYFHQRSCLNDSYSLDASSEKADLSMAYSLTICKIYEYVITDKIIMIHNLMATTELNKYRHIYYN